LLIVRDLASGPRRFVELQRVLPGISTEQLRSRLNRMVAEGMLTRKRYREVPPRVDYELTSRARELMPILGELARWGYEWAWSAPHSSESVDLGAIFRLSPGLVDPKGAHGEVGLTVTDGNRDGAAASYTVTMSGDRTEISETAAQQPDAVVSGDTASWIAAFAPAHDRGSLQVEGNYRLVDLLIDMLALSSSQAEAEEASDSSQVAAA
jgi:DNA-binding HxlR family transcriptional regulator